MVYPFCFFDCSKNDYKMFILEDQSVYDVKKLQKSYKHSCHAITGGQLPAVEREVEFCFSLLSMYLKNFEE